MSSVKEFWKRCQEAKTPWKRASIVYSFIREDLSSDASLDVPENIKKKNIFRRAFEKKKSNGQIVLNELHKYIKEYKDFHIFAILAESPAFANDKDLKKLYNIFIKEIRSTNKNQVDRSVLKVAKRFARIMDENSFLDFYLIFRNSASHSIEKIKSLALEYSDINDKKHEDERIEDDENFVLDDRKDIQEDNSVEQQRADFIRKQIAEERKKLGDDLLDPFFELLSEMFEYIKAKKENNSMNTKSLEETQSDTIEGNNKSSEAIIQRLFNYMYEDLPEFYEYVYSFEGPIRIFFEDPNNSRKPKECVNLYEFLMEINIFSFQNINTEKSELIDFQNMVTGIKNSFIPNISWSNDEYKKFLGLCIGRDINIPLAFMIIDAKKGLDPELDDIFNDFLVNHKDEYMEWCIYGDNGYYDYKFQDKKLYTDNDIEVYSMIVKELMKRQSDKNIRYIDIRNSGNGSTSSTVMIGDYIIKTGLGRYENTIPNHRRILQPIIREYNENAFFEVTDVVDMDVTQDELKQVYYELLRDGFAWTDPSIENIGRLRRKNIPRHGIQKVVRSYEGDSIFDDLSSSDENATNITGSVKDEPLDRGDCVIIDTDLIFDLRTIGKSKFESIQYPPYMTTEMKEDLRRRFIELHAESDGAGIDQNSIDIDENPEGR